MTSYLKPLVASLVLVSSSFALADSDETLPTRASENSLYHVYIGALYKPEEYKNTEYGYGAIAAVGIPLTSISNRLYLELGANHTTLKTDKSMATNFFRRSLTADLQYAFGNRDQLTPFVLAGIGVARNDVVPDELDDTTFTASFGAGLTGLLIGDSVRGRIDLRGIYDDYLDDNKIHGVVTAGIEIPLGRARTETVERIVEVEKQVEVIKEVVKEVAPPDSDGDGIADSIDECPDTLSGVRTDNRGCAIGQTLTIENIEFDFNKATLTANSNAILDSASKFLNSQDNLRVVIAGHTDNVGATAYNQRLSEARARSVMQALIARGIAANRLKTIGLGDSFPRADNSTQEGRDRNRRVEFLLSAADRPEKVNAQQPTDSEAPKTTN